MYPVDAVEMDSLLLAADQAMYVSKARGRNTFSLAADAGKRPKEDADWMEFNDSNLVGVAEIDNQHRHLVRLVNEINHFISAQASHLQIEAQIDGLLKYTVQHFQTEHHLMLAHNYPNTQEHDLEHGKLTSELRQLIRKMDGEGDLLILQKIKDLLITHIKKSDKALGQFLNQEGVF